MKKLFTLIAGLLLTGSGAFAQVKYTNIVENGDFEGEDLSNYVVTKQGTDEKFVPELVEDAKIEGNHCIAVTARSKAEAEELGIAEFQRYDTQFFVTVPEEISLDGKELRFTMKIRADKAAHAGTQCHNGPGGYLGYNSFGELDFTTEWATWSWEGGTPNADMHSLCFDLAAFTEGNVYYFDDIKFEVRDPKEPEPFAGWFNMLRHGTLSEDKIGNFTNFTGRDGATGKDVKARIVEDADGMPALTVASIGWNATHITKTAIVDEEGNPVLDEEGNPTYDADTINIYIKENGDTLTVQSGGFGIDNWQTQFFVTGCHQFTPDSKYRLVMWARADKPATIETQVHGAPGSYLYWQAVGNLELTEEWQRFEFDDQNVSSDQRGFQTIAFNCNVLKDEPNNYYFRFEEFAANAADVKEKERILSQENIILPVPEPSNTDGLKAAIDFTNCKNVLEYESFENLLYRNMSIPKDDEEYAAVDPSAGFFINDKGWLSEEESGIVLEFDEASDEDTQLGVNIYNETGEPIGGKALETKFRFEAENWFYVFNVSLISEESYAGISETKAVKNAGTVYDLMGRKVSKPGKGLYIQDGRKFFVK